MGRPLGSKNVVPKNPQFECGPLYNNYVGSIVTRPTGYVQIIGVHGRGRHVSMHIIIVEKAIGRRLPAGAVVHHANEIKDDNRNGNLCVLQDGAEHIEIHRKRRVQLAGGDPWRDRLCCLCHLPKPSNDFYFSEEKGKYGWSCIECNRAYAIKNQRRLRALDGDGHRLRQRRWYYKNRYGIDRDGTARVSS